MPSADVFALDPRAADRVLDQAFTVNRSKIEKAGDGFDARSLVTGWVGDDRAEEMSLAQVICCIAYHAFIDDDNLRRPAGFRFHKALLASVVGWWDADAGVAAHVMHEDALSVPLLGSPRAAEEIYPEVDDRWEPSRQALQAALRTLVEMGNELLPAARVLGAGLGSGRAS